jgi:uncharacterized hydrophobic protein (TIGR00271 family)
MLHVRVVSPVATTGGVVGMLSADPGVFNLLVLPGVAQHPDGDFVQFDMLEVAANRVLRQLRQQGLAQTGSIAIEPVGTSISDLAAGAAAAQAEYLGDVPVWEEVEASIRSQGAYPPSFFILMCIAGLIGAVGIMTNSQILVVGAMVVCPDYGPIINVALAINQRDSKRIRSGLLALLLGFTGAVTLTLLFSLVIRAAGLESEAFRQGVRPVSDLINTPTVFSVIVAVLAGIVGVVSLAQRRANTLTGVFISVTTIPAAADIGVSTAYASWHEAWGSTLQLILNVSLLIVVGAAVLTGQRAIWRRVGERRAQPSTLAPVEAVKQ